jgi:hypothetical protein
MPAAENERKLTDISESEILGRGLIITSSVHFCSEPLAALIETGEDILRSKDAGYLLVHC